MFFNGFPCSSPTCPCFLKGFDCTMASFKSLFLGSCLAAAASTRCHISSSSAQCVAKSSAKPHCPIRARCCAASTFKGHVPIKKQAERHAKTCISPAIPTYLKQFLKATPPYKLPATLPALRGARPPAPPRPPHRRPHGAAKAARRAGNAHMRLLSLRRQKKPSHSL